MIASYVFKFSINLALNSLYRVYLRIFSHYFFFMRFLPFLLYIRIALDLSFSVDLIFSMTLCRFSHRQLCDRTFHLCFISRFVLGSCFPVKSKALSFSDLFIRQFFRGILLLVSFSHYVFLCCFSMAHSFVIDLYQLFSFSVKHSL